VVIVPAIVALPLSFWRGYVYERRWGFSTQDVRGWLADRAKALAVAVALTSMTVLALVALARALPRAWPLVAASAAAAVVLVPGSLAPVVLEPLFHRLPPRADPDPAGDPLD